MPRPLDPNSKHWHKMRSAVMKRDGVCFVCKAPHHLTAHHIKPRKRGGKTIMRNLIALCMDCHDEIEYTELPWPYTPLRQRKKLALSSDDDPKGRKVVGKDKYGIFIIRGVPKDLKTVEIKEGCFPTINYEKSY